MLWLLTAIIGVLIILLNGILLYTFHKQRALLNKSPNNLICNLAGADLTTGILIAPTRIVEHFFRLKVPISQYLIGYGFFVWLFCLSVITLERDIAMSRPSMHERVLRWLSKRHIILFCWVTPGILTAIPLSWEFLSEDEKKLPADISAVASWILICIFLVLVVGMYVDMFLTLGCGTLRRIRRSPGPYQQDPEETRVAVLLTLLFVVFLLAYLPIMYLNYGTSERRDRVGKMVNLITFSLITFLLHSVFDPLFAICIKRDIQQSVWQTVLHPCSTYGLQSPDESDKEKGLTLKETEEPLPSTSAEAQ